MGFVQILGADGQIRIINVNHIAYIEEYTYVPLMAGYNYKDTSIPPVSKSEQRFIVVFAHIDDSKKTLNLSLEEYLQLQSHLTR